MSSAPAGAPPFHQPATAVPRWPFMAGLPAPRVAGPCFACGEMGHNRLHCPKMATVGAKGTRRCYPFEGGCEGSVLQGGGVELVEGRACIGEVHVLDVVGYGTTDAVSVVISVSFPLCHPSSRRS